MPLPYFTRAKATRPTLVKSGRGVNIGRWVSLKTNLEAGFYKLLRIAEEKERAWVLREIVE